jgi:hypothetical protein
LRRSTTNNSSQSRTATLRSQELEERLVEDVAHRGIGRQTHSSMQVPFRIGDSDDGDAVVTPTCVLIVVVR